MADLVRQLEGVDRPGLLFEDEQWTHSEMVAAAHRAMKDWSRRTAYRRCDDCKDETNCELRIAFANHRRQERLDHDR